ncbi:MAG: hypothetical protein JW807_12275 [Spirochaetes bacterium]|nr:hypothetical protein [Spirochaetota bacterium]
MKIGEIIKLLNAEVHYLHNNQSDAEIKSAAACDLLSDILARVHVPDLLLTGLNNAQAIRTCSVFGIKAVVIVRGRPIDQKLIDLAHEEEITLLSTKDSLFIASGKLFSKGIEDAFEPCE